MDQPPDPFEFLKKLWAPMGLPLAGLTGPTTAASEVEQRIAELKSVENWLNMNLSVLRMTIQGLEMQKAALAAMQSAAGAGPGGSATPTDTSRQPAGGEAPPKK
jgi:hypothetical protein